MLTDLKDKLDKVSGLLQNSNHSLDYFYSIEEKAFEPKKGKGKKPLSHALCTLTSINLNKINTKDKKKRIEQLEAFFLFENNWSFVEKANTSYKDKQFDFYVQSVCICCISNLVKDIDDYKFDSRTLSTLKTNLTNYVSLVNSNVRDLVNDKQNIPQNHPMFIYWIRRTLHEIVSNPLLKINDPKQNIDKINKTILPDLDNFMINQVYYYISMCTAIKDNEEDALKLGYFLYSLSKYGNFPNDVLLEHGLKLVFSILFSENRLPKIQSVYRNNEKLNLDSSPVELLILLSDTRPIQNNFDDYLKFYEIAFNWINSTKRKIENNIYLWMVEPWRGADVPEAWLNCLRINFLHLYNNLVRNKLKTELLEKYKADSSIPNIKWNEIKLDNDIKFQIEKLIEKVKLESEDKRKLSKCSLLLYGPPGTAKTFISRAIAYELGFPIIIISPHYFAENGMDGIIKSARVIFDELSILDNCLILFDELDELVSKRDVEYEKLSKFITTSMLPWFQDLHDQGDVFFIATTNHIQQFDPAIKRPGRFDYVLPIGPPNPNSIKDLLSTFLKNSHSKESTIELILDQIKKINLIDTEGRESNLTWNPTIGEIKTISEILIEHDISFDKEIIEVVNQIGSNPLIGFSNQNKYEIEKKSFRYPPSRFKHE